MFDLLTLPLILFLRWKPDPRPVRKILVVRLDQIGDLVCALPVFPELRAKYPYAKISVLADVHARAVLANNPFVDKLFTFRNNWFSRNGKWSWFNFWRVIFELRKEKFDLGIDLRGDIRNILLLCFAGVRYRIGYGIGGGRALLHKKVKYRRNLHQVELNARVVASKNIPRNELKPEIYLSQQELNHAREYLRGQGVQEGETVIAVHPEAGYPSKSWGNENFAALIQKLTANPGNKILVLGLKEAHFVAEACKESDRVIDLVGKLGLRDMIAVLANVQVFVGNDSGPSHLAQAVGTPCVILASGTNRYEDWGLWREPLQAFYHDVPCAPCYLSVCKVKGHPCMSNISVEDVLTAVNNFTSKGVRSAL